VRCCLIIKIKRKRAEDVAQWQRTCPAFSRSQVQFPVLKREKKKKKTKDEY
jgi:hypothetical protein